jgi:hypothetical protein
MEIRLGKEAKEILNPVWPCKGYTPAVMCEESHENRSGLIPVKISPLSIVLGMHRRLRVDTHRLLHLLPPSDFIALLLQATRDRISIGRVRLQRLERSSE